MPFSDVDEVTPANIEVATTPLAEKLRGSYAVTDVIDWCWRNFLSDLGEGGLYKTLVEPVTGDFNRIAANGDAWNHVAESLGKVSNNVTENEVKLITESWTEGPARAAFQTHIEVTWVGALFIAKKSAEYMAKGFEKLSEYSIIAAEKVVSILDRIIDRIIKLAAKAVPAIGWLVGAVEWIASGFKDFPYWSDVDAIIGLVNDVLALHQTISDLVANADAYFKAFQEVLDAVGTIPEINSTHDVLAIADTINSGRQDMDQARTDFEQSQRDLDQQLTEIDTQARAGGL
ncbi:hypothetical protein [Actinokineospora sp.]|uniref:hypothetical protein n=1 Tax=Actinokineospora sp. TaxID=1872133 RepID=UPI0040383789